MKNNKELRNTLQELVNTLEMSNLSELRNLVNGKYNIERNKILVNTVQYLKDHSDTEYTAAELASGTGLSVQSIAKGLCDRGSYIKYRIKKEPVRYARLDESGNADYNHVVTFNKKVKVYSFREQRIF